MNAYQTPSICRVVLSETGDVLLSSPPRVLLLVGRHTHTTHIQIHRHTECSRVYIHIHSGTQSSSIRRDCGVWGGRGAPPESGRTASLPASVPGDYWDEVLRCICQERCRCLGPVPPQDLKSLIHLPPAVGRRPELGTPRHRHELHLC